MSTLRYLVPCVLLLAGLRVGALAAARQAPFTFVQIADTQLGFCKGDNDLTLDLERFGKAVDYVNRVRPAFVIISGDLINKPHDPAQIRAFWREAHRIDGSIPLHLVAGNHDIDQPSAANVNSYRKLFGKDFYSFSFGGSEFIVLDSCLIHDADADPALRGEQRSWFEDQLARARSGRPDHIFVFTHHPWFTGSADEGDQYYNIPGPVRAEYLGLMKRSGVDFAVAGHYHRNAIANGGSLSMITTAAVGRPFDKEQPGLRVFKVFPDRVEHSYYSLDKLPQK